MLSMIFNLLSLFSLYNSRRKRHFSKINLLLANLAVADLIYSIAIPMFSSYLWVETWNFGLFGCWIFMFSELAGIIGGILTVTLLSVERYFEVTDSNKNRKVKIFTKTRIKLFIVACWLLAGVFVGLILPSIRLLERGNQQECSSTWPEEYLSIFFTTKFIIIFLIPYMIILISSIKLLLFLNKWRKRTRVNKTTSHSESRKRLTNLSRAGSFSRNSFLHPNDLVHELSVIRTPSPTRKLGDAREPVQSSLILADSMSQSSYYSGIATRVVKRDFVNSVQEKATRLVLAIVFVFLLQWSPFWFFQFFQMFSDTVIENVQLINLIISVLSYSNTVVNPFLYMLLTHNFKEYLKTNCFKKICKCDNR